MSFLHETSTVSPRQNNDTFDSRVVCRGHLLEVTQGWNNINGIIHIWHSRPLPIPRPGIELRSNHIPVRNCCQLRLICVVSSALLSSSAVFPPNSPLESCCRLSYGTVEALKIIKLYLIIQQSQDIHIFFIGIKFLFDLGAISFSHQYPEFWKREVRNPFCLLASCAPHLPS